jgi:RES domain-containing protein
MTINSLVCTVTGNPSNRHRTEIAVSSRKHVNSLAILDAISHEECGVQTEAVFSLDQADHNVESAFPRVGCSFVKFLCCPGAMSPLRTVIAISDRMPEIGREAVRTPIGLARLRPTSRKP